MTETNVNALAFLPPSVPSVPQGVSALSTGHTTVLVTWMEPAVYFRECIHDWNAAIDVLCTCMFCIIP